MAPDETARGTRHDSIGACDRSGRSGWLHSEAYAGAFAPNQSVVGLATSGRPDRCDGEMLRSDSESHLDPVWPCDRDSIIHLSYRIRRVRDPPSKHVECLRLREDDLGPG